MIGGLEEGGAFARSIGALGALGREEDDGIDVLCVVMLAGEVVCFKEGGLAFLGRGESGAGES